MNQSKELPILNDEELSNALANYFYAIHYKPSPTIFFPDQVYDFHINNSATYLRNHLIGLKGIKLEIIEESTEQLTTEDLLIIARGAYFHDQEKLRESVEVLRLPFQDGKPSEEIIKMTVEYFFKPFSISQVTQQNIINSLKAFELPNAEFVFAVLNEYSKTHDSGNIDQNLLQKAYEKVNNVWNFFKDSAVKDYEIMAQITVMDITNTLNTHNFFSKKAPLTPERFEKQYQLIAQMNRTDVQENDINAYHEFQNKINLSCTKSI